MKTSEATRARVRDYAERNRDKVLMWARARYARNKARILEQKREQYAADPVSGSQKTKQWRAKNRERYLENDRRWRDTNREKLRAKDRAAQGLPEPTRPAPGVCECCGKSQLGGKVLALDHCHATGAFRGWLCNRCNTSIGHLGDNKEGLLRAIKYLERSTQ